MIQSHLPAAHAFEPNELKVLQQSFDHLKGRLRAETDHQRAVLASALIELYEQHHDLSKVKAQAASLYQAVIAAETSHQP